MWVLGGRSHNSFTILWFVQVTRLLGNWKENYRPWIRSDQMSGSLSFLVLVNIFNCVSAINVISNNVSFCIRTLHHIIFVYRNSKNRIKDLVCSFIPRIYLIINQSIMDKVKDKMVRLKSSDGEVMEVEEAVASKSDLIRMIIMDMGTDTTISLPEVSTTILEKIIEYCRFHTLQDPVVAPIWERSEKENWEEDWKEYRRAREEHDRRIDDLRKWDHEFVRKMDTTTLCKLVESCDYLDISNLRNLAGRCCGERITEKTMALFNDSRRSLYLPIRVKEDDVNGGAV